MTNYPQNLAALFSTFYLSEDLAIPFVWFIFGYDSPT